MASLHQFQDSDESLNWFYNITHYIASANEYALYGHQLFAKLINRSVPTASMKAFALRWSYLIPGEKDGESAAFAVKAATSSATARNSRQAVINSSNSTVDGLRSAGNIFNYVTSKWAFGCIITALVLNRTNLYARTRRNLSLSWKVRLLLRIIPIFLLATHARELLQSIHCQTSTNFAMLRWGNASMHSELLFTQNGGFLHEMSSILLLKTSDKNSCQAVGMIPSESNLEDSNLVNSEQTPIGLKGSLSLLWPLYKTLSFSQFIETISCAIQGRQMAAEYGMSFFELSLAFTEAEAMAFGKVIKEDNNIRNRSENWTYNSVHTELPNNSTRSMIISYSNTSPEALLIGLISVMNHLTSHVLAIFDQQVNFRLLNTGVWGLSYIASIAASVSTFSINNALDQSLLRFPTVCIISFIPHLMILFGIICCSAIYTIALVLTALACPVVEEANERQLDTKWPIINKIILAHQNMQANVSFSRIQISLRMDFYTVLLRTGFSIISMANDAVYLNESRGISIRPRTWLEDDRLQELEAAGLKWLDPNFGVHSSEKSIAEGLSNNTEFVSSEVLEARRLNKPTNGYAREMIAQSSGNGARQRSRILNSGVGVAERSGKWYMAFELCLGFSRLLLSLYGTVSLWLMARLGIRSQPRWLLWMASLPKHYSKEIKPGSNHKLDSLNQDLVKINGKLESYKHKDVDIEAEFRRLAHQNRQDWTDVDENELDAGLYRWWLDGGWWGEKDNSGNFVPIHDEDSSSVVSTDLTDDQSWLSDSADEADHRTPTQRSPLVSRESTPSVDTTLTPSNLVQLLDPKTSEQRAEAESLAIHLSNDQIVTRSRFIAIRQRSRSKVLLSTLQRPENFVKSSPSGKLTLEEESQILEHLIITRRGHAGNYDSRQSSTAWASGVGENGPKCVVCQTSPRCIIVWPCRCLSLCNDCRVTLAMNNFEKCVCCRGDVWSFSRIFVP